MIHPRGRCGAGREYSGGRGGSGRNLPGLFEYVLNDFSLHYCFEYFSSHKYNSISEDYYLLV